MDSTGRASDQVRILTVATALLVLLVILTAFTKYIYAKDYYFFVEAPCNSDSEQCYIRSCDDYCPPNGLESYKVYIIKAKDFGLCTDNTCANICQNQPTVMQCEEVICDVAIGDECST